LFFFTLFRSLPSATKHLHYAENKRNCREERVRKQKHMPALFVQE
jgi:hypothetical protein